jgi:hypothetical protein
MKTSPNTIILTLGSQTPREINNKINNIHPIKEINYVDKRN